MLARQRRPRGATPVRLPDCRPLPHPVENCARIWPGRRNHTPSNLPMDPLARDYVWRVKGLNGGPLLDVFLSQTGLGRESRHQAGVDWRQWRANWEFPVLLI
jgi:hypothetical protein